jgi:hypothetical protein
MPAQKKRPPPASNISDKKPRRDSATVDKEEKPKKTQQATREESRVTRNRNLVNSTLEREIEPEHLLGKSSKRNRKPHEDKKAEQLRADHTPSDTLNQSEVCLIFPSSLVHDSY